MGQRWNLPDDVAAMLADLQVDPDAIDQMIAGLQLDPAVIAQMIAEGEQAERDLLHWSAGQSDALDKMLDVCE